ncbi:MAG: hypothetical protein A3C36_01335 [Omnitrophica WOR_2 bacterium RIFCSPHIGHO2_02_FULL_52_10]|nr:MAG: hypothetical protein A3C36_01335 [Omnitrophica WOR_2 bacterium RIFCSPHIGHO2_02_FULL_52_10]
MMMNNSPKKKSGNFTPSQVGALFESLKSDIRLLAEGLSDLRGKFDMMFAELGRQREEFFLMKADMNIIKSDMSSMKTDMSAVKDLLKNHDKRLSQLEISAN